MTFATRLFNFLYLFYLINKIIFRCTKKCKEITEETDFYQNLRLTFSTEIIIIQISP